MKNFLRGEKPHVLCFWQMNDENDVLSHSLARLSDDEKVDSNNPPTTSATRRNISSDETIEKMLRLSLRKKCKNHLTNFLMVHH